MPPQSVDTQPEAEQIMIDVIRKAPMSKRFRLVQSLTQSARWSSLRAWRERHPGADEQEAAIGYVSCSYGPALAQRVQTALEMREHWYAQPADLVTIILPALGVCDELNVPSYLGARLPVRFTGCSNSPRTLIWSLTSLKTSSPRCWHSSANTMSLMRMRPGKRCENIQCFL